MSAVIREKIRQDKKPSKTRCGRQESRGVVRNPINLNFVIINSLRIHVLIISMIIILQHALLGLCHWSSLGTGAFLCWQVITIAIIIIHHHERPQHHRVSLLLDFPARQVTSSRSSVLDLLLLTKAVSKN